MFEAHGIIVLAWLLVWQGINCASVMVSSLFVLLVLNRCHDGKRLLEIVVLSKHCDFLVFQQLMLLILAFILQVISMISAFGPSRGLTTQIVAAIVTAHYFSTPLTLL